MRGLFLAKFQDYASGKMTEVRRRLETRKNPVSLDFPIAGKVEHRRVGAMTEWHYHTLSGSNGTTSQENLAELVSNGTLKAETFVWKAGMAEWKPAALVLPQFFSASSSPPPPPLPEAGGKRSHDIDFTILGESMQMVEIELDPHETVIAEAGSMNYMEDGIAFETKMGDGSNPDTGFMGKLMQVGKRALTGESLFMTHFTNRSGGKKTVAFASPYPGTIIPIDLAQIGGELLCQRDSFLCAAMGTQVGMAFNQKLGAGLLGGEGFILQRLNGDGMAFIHAGGMVIRKELKGEKLMVDTGCLVGFTKTIQYDIQRAGNLKSMILGGEGLFLATLQGHGTVWLQSLPFGRMAARIIGAGGGRQEQGGVVGGLSSLFSE
ncbi:MAG: hypothetical protein RI957_90 [Verrucomicrobiota bacterium]|jgi:uncharacterized protein (TIGR00266 family)